jgi:hypothetical protein
MRRWKIFVGVSHHSKPERSFDFLITIADCGKQLDNQRGLPIGSFKALEAGAT